MEKELKAELGLGRWIWSRKTVVGSAGPKKSPLADSTNGLLTEEEARLVLDWLESAKVDAGVDWMMLLQGPKGS